MNLAHLFWETQGRLARRPFWLGVLALIVVVALANAAAAYYDPSGMDATPPALWYRVASLLLMAAIAWPTYALLVKRLHDRGQGPHAAIVYSVLALLLHAVDAVYPLETPKGDLLWPGLAIGAPLVLVVIALIVEGMRRGDTGPNAHGPDPLAQIPSGEPPA